MIVRNFFSSGEEGGKLALLPQSVFRTLFRVFEYQFSGTQASV